MESRFLCAADFLALFRLDLRAFLNILNAVFQNLAGDAKFYWLTYNRFFTASIAIISDSVPRLCSRHLHKNMETKLTINQRYPN